MTAHAVKRKGAALAPNPRAKPHNKSWWLMLRISTAHLSGDTLRLVEAWGEQPGAARPQVPMFAPHPFGFFCSVPAEWHDWPGCPDDLREAITWAGSFGAQYLNFDADGHLHDALPDRSDTHGAASRG